MGHKRSSTFNLLKPSGFCTYHQVKHSEILHGARFALSVFVRIWEQTAAFALYIINWLVFITVVQSIYSAVRTDSLCKADYA